MIFDVTVPITNTMPVWPGDPLVHLTAISHLSRDKSHTVKLTAIEMGSHTGTHVDAPSQFANCICANRKLIPQQFRSPADHARDIKPGNNRRGWDCRAENPSKIIRKT